MMPDTVSLIAFAVFAVANWIAVARKDKPLEYITKPAALASLIIYAATGDHSSAWLITALAFSLLGDVYLMLPVDVFAAGLGAFLIGHVAYVIDFEAALLPRLGWWVAVIALSAPFALRIMRSVNDRTLRYAIAGYMIVIALMVASAIASGHRVAIAGAVLFLISDTLLAWDRFVRPVSWSHPVIMATYHLGQLGLTHALRG